MYDKFAFHFQAFISRSSSGDSWPPPRFSNRNKMATCTKREPVDRQMSMFASDSTPRGWMVDGKRPAARFNARTRGSRRRRRRRKKWGRSVRGVHRIFAISVRVSILFSRRGSLRGTPALRPSLLFLFPSFCNVGNRILIRFSASLLSFLFFARDGLAGGDPPV